MSEESKRSTVEVVANTVMNLKPGVLMIAAGIILVMMSATESWGAFNVNPEMGSNLFDFGCVVFVIGAMFSWYRAKIENEQAKDKLIENLHKQNDETQKQLGRLEARVEQFHGPE